jgi:hypothetical protein
MGGALMALSWAAPAAASDPDIEPGMALAPEAAQYEAQLQGRDPEVLTEEDSVERRRQFDDRLLTIGAGLNVAAPLLAASAVLELSVWDRLALGAELSASIWGRGTGLHVRGRPIVWGGRHGRRVLHALTLQGQYRYMAYGEPVGIPLCHTDCDRPRFIDMPAHFGALEAGFEHAFSGGLTLRYAWGAAFQ